MKYIMTIKEGEFVVEAIKADKKTDLDLFLCEDFSYNVEDENGNMLLLDASFSEAIEWVYSKQIIHNFKTYGYESK